LKRSVPVAEEHRDLAVRVRGGDDDIRSAVAVEVADGDELRRERQLGVAGRNEAGRPKRGAATGEQDRGEAAVAAARDREVGGAVAVEVGGCEGDRPTRRRERPGARRAPVSGVRERSQRVSLAASSATTASCGAAPPAGQKSPATAKSSELAPGSGTASGVTIGQSGRQNPVTSTSTPKGGSS
jgi:hypothetical protein